MPDLKERSLECSTLFLVAEILEVRGWPDLKAHPDHIARLRAVGTRMSIELEEIRLRRSIEDADPQGLNTLYREICTPQELERMGVPLLADVAPGLAPSSPLPDSVVLKRYLELDRCLE